MQNHPALIAVDLDGTVFGPDHKTIPPYTDQVLRRCIDLGTQLVPATGRCKAIVPLDAFPQIRYMICSNGGCIWDLQTGQLLRTAYIPRESVRSAWALVRERVERLRVVMELYVDDQIVVEQQVYTQPEVYQQMLPPFHRDYIYGGHAELVSSFDEYLKDHADRVVKINFPGSSLAPCPELKEELIATGLFEVTSDGLNLELNRKGCHKGEALQWLCRYLGISTDDAVAFGNGNNDVAMLRAVGYGVAMGNSAPQVRAMAPYCTASNTENGIARFLEAEFPLADTMQGPNCTWELTPLHNAIDAALEQHSRVCVAIDGPSAAGKTTLAAMLAQRYDCNVFHMDDFFLQPEQRTTARFAQPGGNVDYERFLEEVLIPMQAGTAFSYRPFDCKAMRLAPPVAVTPKRLNVVEGAYSLHPYFGNVYTVRVFLTVPEAVRRRRILQRPAHLHQRFFEEWIPMEKCYFSNFSIVDSCEIVI